MSFTRNVFQKRGMWHRFEMPTGFSPSAIHADRRGLIWFSQRGGSSATIRLGCFDGLHTRSVLPELHIDVPLRHVGFSGDDRWWGITKDSRLLSVNLNDCTVTDYTSLVPDLSNACWLWTAPRNSDIVIGLPNKLIRFDKQNATLIDLVSDKELEAHGVAISPRGELWFTSNTGLYRYDGKKSQPIMLITPDVQVVMWELLVSHDDVVWIATPDGILTIEGGSCSIVKPELHGSDYSALIEDDEGNVWLKASDVAVSCVTPNGVVHFTPEDGLAAQSVMCATQDRQKRLWFAGKGVGLCMYDPETFLTITPHCANASSNSDKGVFLGTPMDGLLHWEEDALTIVNKTIACGSHSALCRGPAGQLLVTTAHRLYSVDLETMQSGPFRGIGRAPVLDAICDRNGVVWVATMKCIVRYEGDQTWQSPYVDLGIHRSSRTSILEFSRGVLVLAGANNGGLSYFDGKEPKWLDCMLPSDNPVIVCGCEDSRKRLWLATDEGPIFCFDGTATREVLPDGQSVNVVTNRIIEDSRGAIWFGTTKGIVKYDGQAFQRMTTASGLPEDHIKGLNLLSNGDIIIATIRGAYRYHPRYGVTPLIRVTRVVTNVTHDATTMVCMHAGIPAVTISYEGSSTKMGRLKYLYRLEGYEAGWRETWDENVRYEGLPAGNYIFRVKALDFDFMYSEEAPPVTLHVEEDPSKKTIDNLKTQLESTQDFSDNIIRSINDAIIVIDTSGSIVVANHAALDLTGFARQQLLGMHASMLLCEDRRQLLDDRGIQRIFDGHAISNLEGSLLASGDKCVPVLLSASVMCDRTGQVQGIVITVRDLTSYKALQQRLEHMDKMESVGRLAGGVAHDFNNLLMGIMGYAELARDQLPKDHPVRGDLDEITKEAQRSSDLTRQLLTFARKQIIEPKVLNINDAVEGILKMLRRLIGEDISVNWHPSQALWLVRMDPSQVDQVLTNLGVNARDAIGGVGSVTVETANVSLGHSFCSEHNGSLPGDYVLLTVSDTGCGMNQETAKHLFEPFFTTKPVGEGTGLGLATVYGIVKQNNGYIDFQSELGKGTTFRIYLPRFVGQEKHLPQVVPSEDMPHGNETILLVEDEKSLCVLACRYLKNLDYTVLAAESPEQALRMAREFPGKIHLLITDVVMPGMNGRDLAQRLSVERPEIKTMFISGFTADIIAQRGIIDDGMCFLPKPFSREELSRKVRQILDRHVTRGGEGTGPLHE